MTRELSTMVTIDHTDGMRTIPDHSYNRNRTIYLRFLRRGSGYLVQAWGVAFPEDGGGGYQGQVQISGSTVQAGVDDLRAAWQHYLIDCVEPGVRPTRRPFVDDWDLSASHDQRWVKEAGVALARAGHTLFSLLFCRGDSGLEEIKSHLLRALREGEQVITVESDDLFVPWGMLYIPLAECENVWNEDYQWVPEGFWGYRHLLEHNFSRMSGFDSRIVLQDPKVAVGLNVDRRVDHAYPPTPYVTPMIEFFSAQTIATVRTRKAELAAALQDSKLTDQIVYFGCHGKVGTTADRTYLILGDDERIYSTEIMAWLSQTSLPTRPVVFVGACQGGQLASAFYPAFGHHLLHGGARCLIGPQIDLPRAFAREYAIRLFSAFLIPHTKLGDIVHDLARTFLDEHRNPLGLIFSLYRGIDVHLSPQPPL
jgi:hypothetical protein